MAAVVAISGYVLCGGRSSRMGVDKATLRLGGVPLVERCVDKLRMVAAPASRVALCGDREDLASYARVVPDAAQDAGPLAALVAALEDAQRFSKAGAAVVLAVDLPLVPWQLLPWMVNRARVNGSWATVPRVADAAGELRPQPLCAVYDARLATALRQQMEAGERKVMRAVEQACGKPALFDVFDLAAVMPARAAAIPQWFLNVNTPGDVAASEQALTQPAVW